MSAACRRRGRELLASALHQPILCLRAVLHATVDGSGVVQEKREKKHKQHKRHRSHRKDVMCESGAPPRDAGSDRRASPESGGALDVLREQARLAKLRARQTSAFSHPL